MTLNSQNGDTFDTYNIDEESFHEETKEMSHVCIASDESPTRVSNINPDAYNSSYKLFRITAYVMRFISNTKYHVHMRKTEPMNHMIINNNMSALREDNVRAPSSSQCYCSIL